MYEYSATYVNNYDADTVHLVVDMGFNITVREKFRLLGINSPEIRGADKQAAIAGRDYLRQRLEGQKLRIKTEKTQEKFGRWLCRIYVDGVDINAEMVEKGFAVPFMVD